MTNLDGAMVTFRVDGREYEVPFELEAMRAFGEAHPLALVELKLGDDYLGWVPFREWFTEGDA